MSYFEDDKIKTTALNGQSGQIMVKFLKTVEETQKFSSLQDKVQTGETKKQYLQRSGSQLLETLANHAKEQARKSNSL